MTTQAEFEAASQRSLQLPTKPSNMVLLQLYALYKQATEGDISAATVRAASTSRPLPSSTLGTV